MAPRIGDAGDGSDFCSRSQPPNQALHADGARLGETTLMATLGGRRLGAGAAGERQGVGAPAKAGE